MPEQKSKSFGEVVMPFFRGGLSGCIATAIVQPIDMIKVQIQVRGEEIGKLKAAGKPVNVTSGALNIAREFVAKNGTGALYHGISAAFTRQIFYTTSRLGIYQTVFDSMKESRKRELNFAEKCFCSLIAGFFGSIIGTPPDLALIRMQADSNLPVDQRRNYKGVADAFQQIVQKEGFFALWSGGVPTVTRAVVLNLGMLGPYDEAKERLNVALNGNVKKDTLTTQILASGIAGFLASFMSLPFDNAKTKMQKMKKGPDGQFPYKNIFDCLKQSVQREGFVGLWAGYPTFYVRIAPHVMITLVLQDFFKNNLDPILLGKKA